MKDRGWVSTAEEKFTAEENSQQKKTHSRREARKEQLCGTKIKTSVILAIFIMTYAFVDWPSKENQTDISLSTVLRAVQQHEQETRKTS